MGCLKLDPKFKKSALKVVYRNPILNKKGVQRFLSVDPLTRDYPWYTPYQFAGNKPIIAIDLDGLEEKIIINSYYKSAPTQFYDSNGELQSVPNFIKVSQELSKDHVMYSAYANNEKNGTQGTLTLEYQENEKVVEDYNSGKIDKFIDQGIKVSENVEMIGDGIVFGSAALIPITSGATVPGTGVGGVIAGSGSLAKNLFKFMKKGNEKSDLIDASVDLIFEVLPAYMEEAVKASNLKEPTKKVLKAQIEKTSIVTEKVVEEVIEDKRNEDEK